MARPLETCDTEDDITLSEVSSTMSTYETESARIPQDCAFLKFIAEGTLKANNL